MLLPPSQVLIGYHSLADRYCLSRTARRAFQPSRTFLPSNIILNSRGIRGPTIPSTWCIHILIRRRLLRVFINLANNLLARFVCLFLGSLPSTRFHPMSQSPIIHGNLPIRKRECVVLELDMMLL
ncbi:hypothetical protein FALCPG4_015779 [Fusarium falciforme]